MIYVANNKHTENILEKTECTNDSLINKAEEALKIIRDICYSCNDCSECMFDSANGIDGCGITNKSPEEWKLKCDDYNEKSLFR